MASAPICQQLADELTAVIDKYAESMSVSYAEAIGCLEIVKMDCYFDAREDTSEEDSGDPGIT